MPVLPEVRSAVSQAGALFDRKSFCRYGCLVGRLSRLYALFGGTEVRARDSRVCKACGTKQCVRGSETAYGCPTFLYPGKLDTNTYCIQCMECIQACPHDNLAVSLRPWASDLAVEGRPRTDEAYLALLMLAITGFHGLTMTPIWQQLIDAIRDSAGFGRVLGFSTGMALLMLGPMAVYAALTVDGQLFPCLLDNVSVDMKPAWVGDRFGPSEAARLLRGAVIAKPARGREQSSAMHSCMNRFRRILIRCEKKPENYLAMLHLALAYITFNSAGLLLR